MLQLTVKKLLLSKIEKFIHQRRKGQSRLELIVITMLQVVEVRVIGVRPEQIKVIVAENVLTS